MFLGLVGLISKITLLFITQTELKEKHFCYDRMDRPNELKWFSNGALQQTTQSQHNCFGDVIKEGEGNDNFFAIWHIDNTGAIWSSNPKGITTDNA
jgi:hypothetical protein